MTVRHTPSHLGWHIRSQWKVTGASCCSVPCYLLHCVADLYLPHGAQHYATSLCGCYGVPGLASCWDTASPDTEPKVALTCWLLPSVQLYISHEPSRDLPTSPAVPTSVRCQQTLVQALALSGLHTKSPLKDCGFTAWTPCASEAPAILSLGHAQYIFVVNFWLMEIIYLRA